MAIRKAFFSLLSRTPLLNQIQQAAARQSGKDSHQEQGTWFRELEKKDGLDAQCKWIREHKAIMREGKQLVQREMHISAQLAYIQNTADEKRLLDPSTQDQILKYEAELKQINREYLQYCQRIAELESYKPPGRLAGRHLDLHGQQASPEVWKAGQDRCRRRGGCCARDCGCCERNLRIVRDRAVGMQYIHCRRGCGCCKRHRGESRALRLERQLTPDGYVP